MRVEAVREFNEVNSEPDLEPNWWVIHCFFVSWVLGAIAGIVLEWPVLGVSFGSICGLVLFRARCLWRVIWKKDDAPCIQNGPVLAQQLSHYMNGKIQRYTLLFAINGGAFAIVEILADHPNGLPGRLSMEAVAVGANIFTVVMTYDIWSWGRLMRRVVGIFVFGWIGQLAVLTIAALIMSAWYLAAMPAKAMHETITALM